jgi:hypothetical protein
MGAAAVSARTVGRAATALGDASVNTAVLPAKPAETTPNGELTGVEINIRPPQAEDFALAQPEQRETPARPITASTSSRQNAGNLLSGVGVYLRWFVSRCRRESNRVASDVAAPHGLIQRRVQRAFDMDCRAGRASGTKNGAINPLDMFRAKIK